MNKIQNEVIEEFVNFKIAQYFNTTEREPDALYEALDCMEHSLGDSIIELLEDNAYVQPEDIALTPDSIDEILEYADIVELDIMLGFGSVLESYVISKIGQILGMDLLELM